nr:sodium- and chloride-dependent GABA transporter ine-like [Leptinotarsa decemlineata]
MNFHKFNYYILPQNKTPSPSGNNFLWSLNPPEEYTYGEETDDGSEEGEDSEYNKPRRQHWSNKLQFVLACVGYSVGLGSIWRFPYLCYKSGGAVFLIPYAIIMVFIGGPMLYMELAVGQFTGRGPIGALGHLCPLLKGTGLGSVVISFLISTYYSVIIAYGVYYFFTSFRAKQPWEDCHNRWNTKFCWVPSVNHTKPHYSQSPAEEFYE